MINQIRLGKTNDHVDVEVYRDDIKKEEPAVEKYAFKTQKIKHISEWQGGLRGSKT